MKRLKKNDIARIYGTGKSTDGITFWSSEKNQSYVLKFDFETHIKGLRLLEGSCPGEQREIFIPPHEAYGSQSRVSTESFLNISYQK